MPLTDFRSSARRDYELPPAAPLPAALQTLACRWWPYDYLERCHARYGDRFTIYPVDMPPLVFLADPQDIRAVAAAPADILHSGSGGTVMAPLFGESAFALREGDEHLSGRNAIMPAFHRDAVQVQAETIAEIVEDEVARWPNDRTLQLTPRIQKMTIRVMLTTAIGSERVVCEELEQRLLGMLSVMASFVLQEPRLRHLPVWRRTWRGFVAQRRAADELIFGLIGRRRREGGTRGDLLDRLLAAHNPDGSQMSDRQVRDNFVSVLIAGHETTAATLGWAFQLLAHDYSVQGRLIEELDSGTGDAYMNATIQETLRHKPTFLFLPPRPVVGAIEIGGWTYRAPAQLLGCTYLMHHNPGLYCEPESFRPERFLGEGPSPGAWLPWGAGRKRCPGRHLALLEIEAVLAEVLRTRLVRPASARIEHPRWRSVILTPHAGSRVILRRRFPRGGSRGLQARMSSCQASEPPGRGA